MAKVTRAFIEELLPIFVIIFLFAVIFVIYQLIPEQDLRNLIADAGIFGPIVWMFLALLSYVIAPMSGAPLLLIGFYAFGRWVILYVTIVNAIGAIINFSIARRWGRKVVVRITNPQVFNKVDHMTEHYGPVTLFFLRTFLSGMHDTISYVAGLTSISFKEYYVVTLLAFIPSIVLSYLSTLLSDDPVVFTAISLALSFGLSAVFFGARYLYIKYQKDTKKL